MIITKEYLKSLHTKQLLNALRRCCVNQEQLDEAFDNADDRDSRELTNKQLFECTHAVPVQAFGHDEHEGWTSVVTIAELKQELSTREHVMNKLEVKEARRAKAKLQKNR